MKKNYLNNLLYTAVLLFSVSLNFLQLAENQRNRHYKERIIELQEKSDNTASIAMITMYQDSINNVLNNWLSDETSK
jgi:hypothetical protein